MKKFKFQLATLLKVTKMKKDEAEVAFAKAAKKLAEENEKLSLYLQEMQTAHRDYEELTKGKTIPLGRLTAFNSYFDWKRRQIEAQQQLILRARAEHQKKLKELTAIMNRLKSIEELKKRRYNEYMAEFLAEEQKELDEIGLQLFMRRRSS